MPGAIGIDGQTPRFHSELFKSKSLIHSSHRSIVSDSECFGGGWEGKRDCNQESWQIASLRVSEFQSKPVIPTSAYHIHLPVLSLPIIHYNNVPSNTLFGNS